MRILAAVLVFLTIIMYSTAGLDEALKAMDASDYKTAIKEFSGLAEKGDDKAMVQVGLFYYHGEGVKQDYVKAFEWYLKAMDKGNADAFNNLGVMFRDGQGVPKDLALAYALVGSVIDKGCREDTLGRAKHNMEQIETIITADDYKRAQKLLAKNLTSDLLKKRCSEKDDDKASGAKINTESLWPEISKQYKLDKKPADVYKGVKISRVHNDEYNEYAGGLGFTFKPVIDFSRIISSNIYTCAEGRFSIVVPRLSKDLVEVHISKVGDQSSQVKFFEDGSNSIQPWDGRNTDGHAVAITQVLPDQWEGTAEDALQTLLGMQEGFLGEIPTNMYRTCIVDGKLGKAVQSIVLNRRGSAIYPQTGAKLFPMRDGIATIGINRVMYIDRVIVELGLIIPKPRNMKDKDLVNYAVDQMNIFMSGFKLLPAKPEKK